MSEKVAFRFPAFPFWIALTPPDEPEGAWTWAIIENHDSRDPVKPAPPPLASGKAPTFEAAQERGSANVRLLLNDDMPVVPAEIGLRIWGERVEIGNFWLTRWNWLILYKGCTVTSGWGWSFPDARRMAIQALDNLLSKHSPHKGNQ